MPNNEETSGYFFFDYHKLHLFAALEDNQCLVMQLKHIVFKGNFYPLRIHMTGVDLSPPAPFQVGVMYHSLSN